MAVASARFFIGWSMLGATTQMAYSGVPAIFVATCRKAKRPRWSLRPRVGDAASHEPAEAFGAEHLRRERLIAMRIQTCKAELRPSWCWPPISSSSRPPAASRRARAHAAGDECAPSSPATTGSPTGAATR